MNPLPFPPSYLTRSLGALQGGVEKRGAGDYLADGLGDVEGGEDLAGEDEYMTDEESVGRPADISDYDDLTLYNSHRI
ncbi:hypothetical protein IAR50_004288 [Cryptococcus sp. DSM 104548]